ncbi:MAG: glucosylglycerol-phosphate synthase [Deltaproteobacteria bacterium]|nr:glucosylglycerol-phosphate synthase [Deltaproteobacteria bacterium]
MKAVRSDEKLAVTPFVLATDLDGTLLGGREDDRSRLFSLLRARSPEQLLIFVSGRGLETVLPVLNDPLVPRPDYVIADVGATVVHGTDLAPVDPILSGIAGAWPGTHQVLTALARFPELQRQTVPQERRCSFFLDPALRLDPDLLRTVKALDCDLVRSAGRYLDVLPHGVSKGSTLRALLRHLALDAACVVTAGDTLNDLSMLEAEWRSVVVGGAEEALTERLRDREGVYHARAPGAGGILEGLERLGVLASRQPDRPVEHSGADPDVGSQLVMVYHRLPYDEVRDGARTTRRRPRSPNGILPTLLGFFAGGRPGHWVAWSHQESRAPEGFESEVPVDREHYPRLTAARVALTRQDVDLFYKRFSKEAFWPIIFSFPGRVVFHHDHWAHFVEVNRLFAERAAAVAGPGAIVWVHDYNLWLVPGHLRQLRPDLRIGFFHHTAFPPSDVFNIIPWYREIVGSLVQCDYIGFHIPRYVENFADVVRSRGPARTLARESCAPRFVTYGCALGVDVMTTALEVNGRRVGLGAHPVGIDVRRIRELLERPEARERMREIRTGLRGRRCVLSIARLDYVKGPLEKLAAFERLLERHPELHGEVELVKVVTPAAPGMETYRATSEKVDQAVGRINGRFGRIDWTPVRYFKRALPFDEVLAYYAVADVAWITPLRDGLNLVAKEYVAAKGVTDDHGVLVLSEFAGAAVELFGALLTNPYDTERMEEDLLRALTMSSEERRERTRRLFDIVRVHDIHRWGREFLRAVAGD